MQRGRRLARLGQLVVLLTGFVWLEWQLQNALRAKYRKEAPSWWRFQWQRKWELEVGLEGNKFMVEV